MTNNKTLRRYKIMAVEIVYTVKMISCHLQNQHFWGIITFNSTETQKGWVIAIRGHKIFLK